MSTTRAPRQPEECAGWTAGSRRAGFRVDFFRAERTERVASHRPRDEYDFIIDVLFFDDLDHGGDLDLGGSEVIRLDVVGNLLGRADLVGDSDGFTAVSGRNRGPLQAGVAVDVRVPL